MQSASVCRIASAVLVAFCWRLANPIALGASEQPAATADTSAKTSDWTIAKLIDAVRTAEKQFANLETVVKKKRFRPGGTAQKRNARGKVVAAGAVHEEIVTRTVLQGNLFYSKTSISRRSASSRTVTLERIAAFDGEKTRTIEIGSAVNVHDGKTCLIRMLPPHSWPLAIEVPFSDFLAGSISASEAHGLPVDSLLTDNVAAPRGAIEPRVVGEEAIKGLSCIRLEFEQESGDGTRSLVRLWLAKERHLIAARQQVFTDSDAGQLPISESRVEDWQEITKNVWLPKRITQMTYENRAAKNRKETHKESRRETFSLEKASLEANDPPEFFRNIGFPPGLPVFTIKNGRLADSFSDPEERHEDETRLREIAEKLREEEGRYNRLSIDATEVRTTGPLFGGIDKTRTTKFHSLVSDEMAYTDAHHESVRFSGSFRPMLWTEAFDGQTYRCYGRHPPPQRGGYAWVSSENFFKKNITLCPAMLRPHSALIPWASSYRRLSEILWPPAGKLPPALEKKVEYLGEGSSGHSPCSVLAIRPAAARAPKFKFLLWLAKDRNLIPVRLEEYRGEQTLPIRLEVVDSFREPSAGVWYPAHKTRYIFRQLHPPAVREGYLFVDQCWDYGVQSVSLTPEAPPGIFSEIVVDEGIDVQYFDKSGKLIGKTVQPSESVPEMPAGK